MSTYYFIEILNAHGDVVRREKFSSLPIRIGRSYDNDIILDDPHISAEHAVVEMDADNHFSIRDLGSNNGIYCNKTRAQNFSIDGEKIFRLGQTLLRVRTNDYAVADEMAYSAHHYRGYWPQAIITLVLTCLLALLGTWLTDIEKGNSSTYFTAVLGLLAMLALWAGMFSLANRVFAGVTNFSRHLFILCSCVLAVKSIDYISAFFAYGFSWEFLTQYGSHLKIILLAIMIYFHLRQISPRKQPFLRLMCFGIAVVSSGLLLLKNYQNSNQYADELYSHELLPPALRISGNHTVDEFTAEIGKLKNKIDKERQDLLKEKQASH